MQSPVVRAEFDAVTRDGREIVVTVAIGDFHDIPSKDSATDVGFYIEVEPLMERVRQGGTDSLMAICFSIQQVRMALKVFVAHGGRLFMLGSRYPIDLDSPWFESVGGLILPEYLDSDSTSRQNSV